MLIMDSNIDASPLNLNLLKTPVESPQLHFKVVVMSFLGPFNVRWQGSYYS